MEKPILIATASNDEHTYGPVQRILNSNNYPVVVYKTDKVLSGEDQFTAGLTSNGELNVAYNGVSIAPEDISAGWYRKVGSFQLPDAHEQLAKQLYMVNEVRAQNSALWPAYPEDVWLSSPSNLARAERKLSQLLVAHEVGFSIPETLMGSDWDAITARLLSEEAPQMALKMILGVTSQGDQLQTLFTTPLNQQQVDQLKGYTVPFPGLFQPFIPKAREWRVTAVGEDVFPAAIHTDEEAKDDWRRLQDTPAVRFEKGVLPKGIDEQCIHYLGKMGLRFGAFDLIETPDGEVVFLECNPDGQYSWLEEELGLPISTSVASLLMRIARRA
ncbi:MAG TPA: hypothetical protein VLI54_03235 [Bacillota bacterium]|nr:hypothetical protein [Bacillota bacterium]